MEDPPEAEEAVEPEREEVGAEQASGVDDGAPGFADAARRGETARREAAEDVGEQVVADPSCRRGRRRSIRVLLPRDGLTWPSDPTELDQALSKGDEKHWAKINS